MGYGAGVAGGGGRNLRAHGRPFLEVDGWVRISPLPRPPGQFATRPFTVLYWFTKWACGLVSFLLWGQLCEGWGRRQHVCRCERGSGRDECISPSFDWLILRRLQLSIKALPEVEKTGTGVLTASPLFLFSF